MQNPKQLTVDVYADIACPWCRIGRNRLRQAAAALRDEIQLELRHLPHQLDPAEPEEPMPLRESLGRKFGAENTEKMFVEMTVLGGREGLDFHLEHALAVNTFTAHRLLRFAAERHGTSVQAALSERLYEAYFRDGLNIADHGTLAGLAQQAGIDPEQVKAFLASDEGVAETRDRIAESRASGVTTVPTTVLPDGTRIEGVQETEALVQALRKAAAAV
ncbi:DsbA family protein [Streptomyces sp. NPDC059909]|uniref:DsbA family oxidoreductase n=1 Tax=Streptomyces sp. NPDC059909 TaxID=3346998 RepID=UPI00364D61A5